MMDSLTDGDESFARRPSHSSPISSKLSDSPFAHTCSTISPNDSQIEEIPECRRPQRRKSKWLPEFSGRQWILFSIFAGTNFLSGMVFNMKGPFYPQEAETKGVFPSEYGLIFGVFDLTKVFASPLFGKYMNQLGARKVFIFSIYVIGICSILFGLLDELPDARSFFICSLFIRIVEAFGSSGYSCSVFSIIAHEFPGSVATTFALLEASFGAGLVIAPPLGGVLFQLAGYPLPFITIGLLIITAVNFVCVVMPHSFTVRDSEGRATEGLGVFKVLKIRGVLFSAVGVLLGASSAGFITATLEPHLRQFDLNPFVTGIVFSIFGVTYAIAGPCWGWVCDRVAEPKVITLIGAVSNFIAFLFVGPAPMFKFDTILWLTCVALILHGLALSAMFVSLFSLAFTYAVASGMPNDMKTHAVVSGMWIAVLSLGMFLGPTIGGILLDRVGFRWGSLFVICIMASLIVLIILYLVLQKTTLRSPTNGESEPLLLPQPLPQEGTLSPGEKQGYGAAV